MTKLRMRSLIALACLVVGAQISRADTIFDDFGPGHTYSPSCCTGEYVSGGSASGLSYLRSLASPFTPAANVDLTQIDVGITYLSGTNSVQFSLVDDSGGTPTGTTIESWTVTALPAFGTTDSLIKTLIPVSTVPLLAGQQYWIVASAPTSDTLDLWNVGNGTSGTPAIYTSLVPGWTTFPGNPLPAYSVLGTPVGAPLPEPASLLLVGFGFAQVTRLVRRRPLR